MRARPSARSRARRLSATSAEAHAASNPSIPRRSDGARRWRRPQQLRNRRDGYWPGRNPAEAEIIGGRRS